MEDTCRLCVRGACGCCKSELESIQLTAAEYQQLKDRVMTDILQGRDVFTKTTPKVQTRTHTLSPVSGKIWPLTLTSQLNPPPFKSVIYDRCLSAHRLLMISDQAEMGISVDQFDK